ncbi:MAG: transporter substrate-binding protein [Actinomycetia bacterium]|nr:transporter substrate-binding protein [Actinomycetes bacterium]
MTTRRRLRAAILLPLLAALLLAACGSDSGTDAAAATKPTVTDDTTPSVPQEPITIKYAAGSNAGVAAYVQKQGTLEKELAAVHATIEWVPSVAAFSANLDAMNAGALNVSQGAVSPVVGALSHGLKWKIFALSGRSFGAHQAGIIATKGSGITTVQDLVGKRVAVNALAHGDYLLQQALKEAGIPLDQVERTPLQPPEAAAAFASGKIDAWATFGDFFTGALAKGAVPVKYEEDLQTDDVGIFAASADLLAKNPKAFEILLKVFNDAIEAGHADPEAQQNVFQQSGPTAVSGERLQNAIAATKIAKPFAAVSDVSKGQVTNVISLFVSNKVLDRDIPVDEITFDLTKALKG